MALEIKLHSDGQNFLHKPEREEYGVKLMSEFLLLIIRIINERFQHLSKLTKDQDIRCQLIHYLVRYYYIILSI